MELDHIKKLTIEVLVNNKTETITIGIAKKGFEESLSGDMEIMGLLEHIKLKFLPNVKESQRFEK